MGLTDDRAKTQYRDNMSISEEVTGLRDELVDLRRDLHSEGAAETESLCPAEVSKWVFREPHSVSDFMKRRERDGVVKKG